MEKVDEKLLEGMLRVKELIIAYSKKLSPATDTRMVEDTPIVCPVDWRVCQMALSPAADITAHDRYQQWYNTVFRGVKRVLSDDESFQDDNSGSDDGDRASLTQITTRSGKILRLN